MRSALLSVHSPRVRNCLTKRCGKMKLQKGMFIYSWGVCEDRVPIKWCFGKKHQSVVCCAFLSPSGFIIIFLFPHYLLPAPPIYCPLGSLLSRGLCVTCQKIEFFSLKKRTEKYTGLLQMSATLWGFDCRCAASRILVDPPSCKWFSCCFFKMLVLSPTYCLETERSQSSFLCCWVQKQLYIWPNCIPYSIVQDH